MASRPPISLLDGLAAENVPMTVAQAATRHVPDATLGLVRSSDCLPNDRKKENESRGEKKDDGDHVGNGAHAGRARHTLPPRIGAPVREHVGQD